MRVETLLGAYFSVAGVWFCVLFFGLLMAIRDRHPFWEEIEEDTDFTEMATGQPQWPTVVLRLFVEVTVSALLWPSSMYRVLRNLTWQKER